MYIYIYTPQINGAKSVFLFLAFFLTSHWETKVSELFDWESPLAMLASSKPRDFDYVSCGPKTVVKLLSEQP